MPPKADPVVDADLAIPVLTWDEFYARLDWRQGEHVAAVGPTGRGKTHLLLRILPKRTYKVILCSKPKDKTLAGLMGRRGDGYVRVKAWPPRNDRDTAVLLWPDWSDSKSNKSQAATFRRAMDDIFREGSWCVFTDDVQYLTDHLGLGDMLRTLWVQARSLGISVVAATQRPAHVPRVMWNQSTHIFIWGTKYADDLRELGGLGGLDAKAIRATVAKLEGFQVLYINTRTGQLAVTQAPAK